MCDAAFTLYALLRLGFTEEAGAFMGWLDGASARGGREPGPLQSCTASTDGEDLPEEELPHLRLHGSAPVRIAPTDPRWLSHLDAIHRRARAPGTARIRASPHRADIAAQTPRTRFARRQRDV